MINSFWTYQYCWHLCDLRISLILQVPNCIIKEKPFVHYSDIGNVNWFDILNGKHQWLVNVQSQYPVFIMAYSDKRWMLPVGKTLNLKWPPHFPLNMLCPVGWGCRIHGLASLQRDKTLPNECPGSDIKSSDGKAPALELCRMWSTLSLPLLPGPIWSGVVTPDSSIWPIDRTLCVQTNDQC